MSNSLKFGVTIHHELCQSYRKGRVTGVKTTRGDVNAGVVIQAVAGHSALLAQKAGFPLPLVAYPLQAMVTLPVKPFLTPLVSSSALHCDADLRQNDGRAGSDGRQSTGADSTL